MSIELVAKVTHYILPNDIIQVCLPDTDNPRDDRHHEHDRDEDDDQAQNGREKDGDENQYYLYFICAKGLGNPTHSAYVGFAPALFHFVGIVFQSTAHAMKCHIVCSPDI